MLRMHMSIRRHSYYIYKDINQIKGDYLRSKYDYTYIQIYKTPSINQYKQMKWQMHICAAYLDRNKCW